MDAAPKSKPSWVRSELMARRFRHLVIPLFLLMTASTTPAAATNNLGAQKWDPQQSGIYNYAPRYYFQSGMQGSCPGAFHNATFQWDNVGRELNFEQGTGYAKWIKVIKADLGVPFHDDYA